MFNTVTTYLVSRLWRNIYSEQRLATMSFSFHWADYFVGIVVLSVPMVIGGIFAVRDKNRSTREEYLVGGRQMALLPVAMSIFITFQSAISLIGIPAEVYFYGSKYIIISIGTTIGYVIGTLTFVPLVYPLRLTSIYDYLLRRYRSNAVRLLSTVLGMMTTSFYMAVALLSPALALQASAGIPVWLSVAIVGSLGTLYTTLGGIKSVIWTDAFQTIIVFAGVTAIMVTGVSEVGSVSEVWDLAERGGRTELGQLIPDPRERHTIFGIIIGGFVLCLVNSFNQSAVQRVCALKSLKDAKLSYLLNVPFSTFYYFLMVIVGNIVYSYFDHEGCGPYEAGIVDNRNQIAPYFVLETMGHLHGLPGLYVSTLCCGSLSTLSSGINALAANTVEDLLRSPLRKVQEGTATLITKVSALLHGLLIIAIAYGMKSLQGPVTQIGITILGAFGSPVLGIFLVGAAVPWANKYGAFIGALVAIVFNVWVGVGSVLDGSLTLPLQPASTSTCSLRNNTNSTIHTYLGSSGNITDDGSPLDLYDGRYSLRNLSSSNLIDSTLLKREYSFYLYDISYEWQGFIGTVVSISITLIVSALARSKEESNQSSDPHLLFPFVRKFWGFSDVQDLQMKHRDVDIDVPDHSGYTQVSGLDSSGSSKDVICVDGDDTSDSHALTKETRK